MDRQDRQLLPWAVGMVVAVIVSTTLGFVTGVQWQRQQECEALGGLVMQSTCVKETEIVRRW